MFTAPGTVGLVGLVSRQGSTPATTPAIEILTRSGATILTRDGATVVARS